MFRFQGGGEWDTGNPNIVQILEIHTYFWTCPKWIKVMGSVNAAFYSIVHVKNESYALVLAIRDL